MGRDLSFWKSNNKAVMDDKSIYTALSNEQYLEIVDELPILQIQNDFNSVFKEWENNNNQFYERGNESFDLMVTKQFVRADCYEMTESSMNKIIDIMIEYDCPLYDSMIDIRFDE